VQQSATLTAAERELLDRVRARLGRHGLDVSDERLIAALLKAAAQLGQEDLVRLLGKAIDAGNSGKND
jgi:hypothetical protein